MFAREKEVVIPSREQWVPGSAVPIVYVYITNAVGRPALHTAQRRGGPLAVPSMARSRIGN